MASASCLLSANCLLQPLPWPYSSGPGLTEGLAEVVTRWPVQLGKLCIGWHPCLLAPRALPAACSLNILSTSWMGIWQDLNIRGEARGGVCGACPGGGLPAGGIGACCNPCCAALGIGLCALIRSILNCLQFPSWGKGGGKPGEVAVVCSESGDSGAVGKPEASWQSCVEFLGRATGNLRRKPDSFRPGKEERASGQCGQRQALRGLCPGEMLGD